MKFTKLFAIIVFSLFTQFSYAQMSVLSFKVQDEYLQDGKILIKSATTSTQIKIEIQFSTARDNSGNPKPGSIKTRLSTGNSSGQIIYLSSQEQSSSTEFTSGNTFITKVYTINIEKSKLTGNLISLLVQPNGLGEGEYTGKRYNYVLEVSTPTTYYNAAKTQSFSRNNCGANYIGSAVTYIVPANTYSSTISQADADSKAQNDINTNGQNYANTNGNCTVSYDNWFTSVDNTMKYGSDWSASITWNKNLVSTSTVSFEVYQNDVFKGVYAANVPNTGDAFLDFTSYITLTGHTFSNIKLKIVSDSDPNIYDFIGPFDMQVD